MTTEIILENARAMRDAEAAYDAACADYHAGNCSVERLRETRSNLDRALDLDQRNSDLYQKGQSQ